jgi:energy-coupling factor transport system substrate-specific component
MPGRYSPEVLSVATLIVISLFGVATFLYPFLLSNVERKGEAVARSQDAPLIFGVVLALALLMFLWELTRQGMNAKVISLLAVVMAAAAVLRVPTLPFGASAFYFMVIVAGYVFGPRLGFLVGCGGLFLSAVVTSGFGPWLPFQMFASGWLGMSAGWLSLAGGALRSRRRLELAVLAAFAAIWGFLFGAIMNLWFWPFVAGGESISWEPGMGLGEALSHYWSFYLLTSAGWDLWRAIANVVLVLLAGRPVIDLLVRYRDRFGVRYVAD